MQFATFIYRYVIAVRSIARVGQQRGGDGHGRVRVADAESRGASGKREFVGNDENHAGADADSTGSAQ